MYGSRYGSYGSSSYLTPSYSSRISSRSPSRYTSKSLDSLSSVSDRYRSNRYGSSSHLSDVSSDGSSYGRISRSGSIGSFDNVDFKRLYEEEKEENRKLKIKLENREDELDQTKKELAKLQQNNRNAQNEQDKKARRALERQVSEMEEEVKQIDKLRMENQRLKDENQALVRVISKLSK